MSLPSPRSGPPASSPPTNQWLDMNRIASIPILAAVLIGLVSCSQSKGPPRKACYPVKGQLTVRGQPAEGAVIMFQPEGANPDEWPVGYPRATVGADGKFEVATYGDNDGAPAGDYKVLINWPAPGDPN